MGSDAIILSFDVEEHYRIEAAANYACAPALRDHYAARMETSTRRLLDLLDEYGAKATFFIVGQIAVSHPRLVRDIHDAGHEIACHSWDHQRLHRLTPATFALDVLRSKRALEQAAGAAVRGYRAPTFSIVRETAWAIDVLAECGFTYDSSIFPVKHDRYGIPDAPRSPFQAFGQRNSILELPPVTLRCWRYNLPVAGGGYFRLFPLPFLEAGIRQAQRLRPAAAMLYFHPWEFDGGQPQLPLARLSRWRTYVGTHRSASRLRRLLARHRFQQAIDVARRIKVDELAVFAVTGTRRDHSERRQPLAA
jgi:polysaccharide deacetylase family protein (PEP-CTERM system associated)